MLRHLRHTTVLAALVLLHLLVVESLLLFGSHAVGTWSMLWRRTGTTDWGRRHGWDIFWRWNVIGSVDAILGARWFGGIQASLYYR
jgi:hypothetical protein